MTVDYKKDIDEAPGLSAPDGGRKIYFVRHGKTEWNNQFRYQGATNVPLCAEGMEQAKRAGLRLSKLDVDAIICSPLDRAFETAGRIAAYHLGLRIEKNPLLSEVNFGEWEGLTVPEIKAHSGEELFYKWRRNELHVSVPGGESADAVDERASRAAEELVSRPEECIVVVGHGAMFRALFLPLLGIPRSNIFWKMRIDNCSISAVSVDKNGKVTLSFLNDTLHMLVPEDEIADLPLA